MWTARLLDGHCATSDALRFLDRDERRRVAQFAFERDRVRFIQAHGFVRRILAGYCDADAAALAFTRNRHGKPSLVPRAGALDLQFSVSHSDDCCMLAVRRDHAIGIDVEQMRDLPRAMDIARRYFTPAESKALALLQGMARRDAFFVLWTHKEAMLKGLGVGLAENLDRIEFDLDSDGDPRLAAWDGDRSVARLWIVRRLDPAPGYLAAVAGLRPIRSLTLREWRPLRRGFMSVLTL